MMRAYPLVIGALAALAPMAASAQGAINLVPHRAVYDMRLGEATDRSGITGITGRMVYEFNGSPCDGYTVSFRFVTEINTSEASRVTDQQTTTFEDAEGKTFNFATKSFVDQQLEREIRGAAVKEEKGLEVTIETPQVQDIELPTTQFPTQHMMELLARAEKGDTFYETNLFDGSEDGDKVMTTSVVIGREADTAEADPEKPALQTLATDRHWPVEIAYFDKVGDEGGEEVPDYRIGFKLHRNGLTRDLTMDYGDFSMTGRLVNLQLFDQPAETCQPR